MRLQRLRQPPVYAAPVAAYGYAGCSACGGWVRERLPDPEQQYYYVNQGPTYTGPGNWRRVRSIAKARSPATAMATTVRIARTAIITGTRGALLQRPARAAPLLLIQH